MTLLDKVDEGELSHSEAAWLAGTLLYVQASNSESILTSVD